MSKAARFPFFTMILISLFLFVGFEKEDANYRSLVEKGDFQKAEWAIREVMEKDTSLTAEDKIQLGFEIDRMHRIRLDFAKTENEILEYVRTYIPGATIADLKKWEDDGSLEFMVIDGKKIYFNNAAPNLFRINKDAKAIKIKVAAAKAKTTGVKAAAAFPLDDHIQSIIDKSVKTKERYVHPVTIKINYTMTVNPNAVPDGRMIRCWIPYPREITNRQTNIKLIKTQPVKSILADNDATLQRTIYLQKPAQKDRPTVFSVEYTYTQNGVFAGIDVNKVLPTPSSDELAPFLGEVPPHIIFTDELKQISPTIIGSETNPYLKAKKIFEWVYTNIPWASAREYSTIRNLSMYAFANRHGDCGIQHLLFITLCRLNGIPAKWQSGWEFKPPDDSMHDWSEIYIEPYGWVPADVTYGLKESPDETHKWFYVGGMDSYRLIFNDTISDHFFPAKIYPRSETVDSQRGEVEWEGGNLYFDQWDWNMQYEVVAK